MAERTPPDHVQQTSSIGNIQSGGNTTIGDINKTVIQYLQQQTDFVKRERLEEYKSPYFTSPKRADELIQNLRGKRLLVLGGNHEDQSDIALHLAVKLCDEIQPELNSAHSSISVWEWNGSSNPQSLFAAIRGEGNEEVSNKKNGTKIFLLPDLQPQHDLNQIDKAAKKGKNYVIATTNVPLKKWKMTDEQKRSFWWEPSDQSPLYQPDDLAKALIQRLKKKKSLTKDIESYVRIIIAQELKTFASVEACIQSLLSEKEPLSEEAVSKAVDSAKKNRKAFLETWFRTLESREQLLALGVSFFDGLFDDQFFAALEKVVRNVWQQRDSTLRALDYCDLENLGNYFECSKITVYDSGSKGFKFVNAADYPMEIEVRVIEIRRTEDRRLLFKVAWDTHRRQILTALSEIVQMVKESVVKQPSNWELYGSSIRCDRLRHIVSQMISDLGLVSNSATSEVQEPLLQLAAYPAFEVQDVAATAMAKWYLYGREQELFGTLRRFYSLAIHKEADEQKTEEWQDHIGATVALTISYAAANALPNELSEEFLNWLKELSESQSSIVRAYFGYHTLSYLVPLHLDKLKEMLKEWTQKHTDLNEAIALSLARAYTVRPSEVLDILRVWYNAGKEMLSDPSKVAEITKSEHLLATVALTYGEIDCDKQNNH